jgi:hypothetical protein
LQIAVANHIDAIGGAHNDGTTWRSANDDESCGVAFNNP